MASELWGPPVYFTSPGIVAHDALVPMDFWSSCSGMYSKHLRLMESSPPLPTQQPSHPLPGAPNPEVRKVHLGEGGGESQRGEGRERNWF